MDLLTTKYMSDTLSYLTITFEAQIKTYAILLWTKTLTSK